MLSLNPGLDLPTSASFSVFPALTPQLQLSVWLLMSLLVGLGLLEAVKIHLQSRVSPGPGLRNKGVIIKN